ncbi:hypothetical protein L6452_14526 [Arctium lappa]|uniref:Uncharacterized protein n=1 Tax=Arctium lappa TaxID=4217 RepID=A0ACB9CL94_ARCLA|nr:hypothetical protein L6452_14526 [Arctium lappa]
MASNIDLSGFDQPWTTTKVATSSATDPQSDTRPPVAQTVVDPQPSVCQMTPTVSSSPISPTDPSTTVPACDTSFEPTAAPTPIANHSPPESPSTTTQPQNHSPSPTSQSTFIPVTETNQPLVTLTSSSHVSSLDHVALRPNNIHPMVTQRQGSHLDEPISYFTM